MYNCFYYMFNICTTLTLYVVFIRYLFIILVLRLVEWWQRNQSALILKWWQSNQSYYYIPNFKRPITLHHSYHVTVQYPTVMYMCYWTVVIAQLSAVDLLCKVNGKSLYEKSIRMRCWFISFDRL